MTKKSNINKNLKMSGVTMFLVSIVLLAAGTADASQQITAVPSRSSTITVHTGRPLAEVLNRVQSYFDSPITFEEAPYESTTDLQTKTVTNKKGTTILRFTPVVDWSVTLDAGDTSPYLAVQSVLSKHANAGFPGQYSMVQENDRIDVIPTQILGASGSKRTVVPVLSEPVTFPLATRRVYDTLVLVADSVSKSSGKKVEILNVPFSYNATIELGASGQPARDVLANIGAKFGYPLSFQCLYDATVQSYYLNLKFVGSPSAAGSTTQPSRLPTPTSGPTNNPFFTKDK